MVVRKDRPVDERDNVLTGTITRRICKGEDYVALDLDAVDDLVEIRLPTPVYERLSLADRDQVRVSLKKRAPTSSTTPRRSDEAIARVSTTPAQWTTQPHWSLSSGHPPPRRRRGRAGD